MSFWARLIRCPPARRGLVMLLVMVVVALAAPLLAPADPWKVHPAARLLPPLSRSAAVDGADASGNGASASGIGTDASGSRRRDRLGPGHNASGNAHAAPARRLSTSSAPIQSAATY